MNDTSAGAGAADLVTLSQPDPALKILFLCDYRLTHAGTILDHINAFHDYSGHEVFLLSRIVESFGNLPEDLDLDLFDVIVIHYSLTLAIDAYISPEAKRRLARFRGLKALFIQDEYRFVDRTIAEVRQIGIQLLFTCVPQDQIPLVYPDDRLPGVHKVNVLTGYVPQWLTLYPTKPLSERSVDVGYRGRRYPSWHGRMGREKWEVAERFLADARRSGLRCDIETRETKRLYGRQWLQFLRDCRAVLGVESGASVFDFDGTVSSGSETYEALLTTKHLWKREEPDYEDVKRKFFTGLEDRVRLEQISPRGFEAVALRTLCILYEGDYSGVLKPWRHYIPLRKDHSNMNEVVAALKDDQRCAEMISRAFAEVAMNPAYSYKTFVARFDNIVADCFKALDIRPAEDGYVRKEFYEQRPLPYTANPHELAGDNPQYSRAKLREFGARVLPPRAKSIIKALVQNR